MLCRVKCHAFVVAADLRLVAAETAAGLDTFPGRVAYLVAGADTRRRANAVAAERAGRACIPA